LNIKNIVAYFGDNTYLPPSSTEATISGHKHSLENDLAAHSVAKKPRLSKEDELSDGEDDPMIMEDKKKFEQRLESKKNLQLVLLKWIQNLRD